MAGRATAALLVTAMQLSLLAGCASGPRAPTFAPPSAAARNLPLFVGSHGGINTGGGPISVGVGVARQTQLVSGSGIRVSIGSASDGAAAENAAAHRLKNGLQGLRTPQQLFEAGLLTVQASSARRAATDLAPPRPGSD